MTELEDRAGWSREVMTDHAVALAGLGFGIVRVCHPLDPGADWPCSERAGHRHPETGEPCASPGKRPIGKGWESTAQHDPALVRTMLGNPGNHAYGIMPPPDAFIWDADGDAPERLRGLMTTLGQLPATRVHRSGNGKHVLYRWPAHVPGGSGNLFDVVTRWPGKGMVVGPGCVHAATATLYSVESDLPIAELPEAWALAAASWSSTHHREQDEHARTDPDFQVPVGERHPWLTRKAAQLRNASLSGDALLDALLALSRRHCGDFPESEVRDIAVWYADKDHDGDTGGAAGASTWPEPEDRGLAVLSDLGTVEYIEDLVRPGRILVVASEEGTGKTVAILGEACIRVAVTGGDFAGTWPVLRNGPVLVLSEQHPDDDHLNEDRVLEALGHTRDELAGRYFRLPLMTAAGGSPALMVEGWRAWVSDWMREQGVLMLVVDTATGATQVQPWGQEIQAVYRALREMLESYPELAVVLLLHLKKPTGKGARGISDVLGEWGRWCDVVLMMENDGPAFERVMLTTRKRVRRQRRVIATKRAYLLVDPVDADAPSGPKVAQDAVFAAILARPGITYVELGTVLGVSKDTASRYVRALGDRVTVVAGGSRQAARVYPAPRTEADEEDEPAAEGAAAPQSAARARAAPDAAPATEDGEVSAAAPHPPYRGAAAAAHLTEMDADLVDAARMVFGPDLVGAA